MKNDKRTCMIEKEVMFMGWKSVDMQVAIPRTQDASNLQEQMTKQHQRFQESLAQNQLKEQLRKRKQVNAHHETERLKNAPDEDAAKEEHQHDENETNDQKQEEANHPYLGKRFDLTR